MSKNIKNILRFISTALIIVILCIFTLGQSSCNPPPPACEDEECGTHDPPLCYSSGTEGCCGSGKSARIYTLETQGCCGSGNAANVFNKNTQCCENGKVKDKCGGECCDDDKPFCRDGKCNKCPEGWTECAKFCCNDEYDKCGRYLLKKICKPKNDCQEPGMKKCEATIPKCCKESETCAVSEVDGVDVAVCVQGDCEIGEEPCGTDIDGKTHCCNPPHSKCEQLDVPDMELCIAEDENECDEQGLQLCQGWGGRGSRCCTPGTCFLDEYGAPKCSDQ